MRRRQRLDQRNRKWGSLEKATTLHVYLSQRTKDILSALRNHDGDQISFGAVIERLAEQHANILGENNGEKRENREV